MTQLNSNQNMRCNEQSLKVPNLNLNGLFMLLMH